MKSKDIYQTEKKEGTEEQTKGRKCKEGKKEEMKNKKLRKE